MGAWIEITVRRAVDNLVKSHPTMGAWIEILYFLCFPVGSVSHPTMGAWIEILGYIDMDKVEEVAPHDGCVDWNVGKDVAEVLGYKVAPHDGCVDWN